jgi:cytoskeletal protein CcmA (bactofilin family)
MSVRSRRERGGEPAAKPVAGLTQVGRQASVRGRMSGPGLLIAHGRLSGTIDLQGEMIVGPGGQLDSVRAKAERLRVEGVADGDFRIEHGLHVAESGRLTGNVTARTAVAAPGARLEATLQIG